MDEIKAMFDQLRRDIALLRDAASAARRSGTWYLLGPLEYIDDGDEILEPGADRRWRPAEWSVGDKVGQRIVRRQAR